MQLNAAFWYEGIFWGMFNASSHVYALSVLISLFLLCEQTHGPLSDRLTDQLLAGIARGSVIPSASGLLLSPCKRQGEGGGGFWKDLTQIRLYIRPCMMEMLLGEQIIRLFNSIIMQSVILAACGGAGAWLRMQSGWMEGWGDYTQADFIIEGKAGLIDPDGAAAAFSFFCSPVWCGGRLPWWCEHQEQWWAKYLLKHLCRRQIYRKPAWMQGDGMSSTIAHMHRTWVFV